MYNTIINTINVPGSFLLSGKLRVIHVEDQAAHCRVAREIIIYQVLIVYLVLRQRSTDILYVRTYLVLRGTIVNRTYGIHKKLYI